MIVEKEVLERRLLAFNELSPRPQKGEGVDRYEENEHEHVGEGRCEE